MMIKMSYDEIIEWETLRREILTIMKKRGIKSIKIVQGTETNYPEVSRNNSRKNNAFNALNTLEGGAE